jgi:hypothetical protein
MSNQRNLSHVLSGDFDSTRLTMAILHTLRATDLTDLLTARGLIRVNVKRVSPAFASVPLGEARR